MSAGASGERKPSQEAIELAKAGQDSYGGVALRCTCAASPEHWADQHDFALAIDALVQRKVEEERCRIIDLLARTRTDRALLSHEIVSIVRPTPPPATRG